jgi:glycosyltransferase involved in cell wall biosynthesis
MVTAVMVTGKSAAHESLARVALRCFLEQTWPAESRELVIINDGPYRLLASPDSYEVGGRPLVREVVVPAGRHPLGELRNIGLDEARGEYVIQWDDDDWHGPGRMELQAGPVLGGQAACTFLTRQVRYSIPQNSAKVFSANRIHGTVMHRACSTRYPAARRSEDTGFMFRIVRDFGPRLIADIDPAPEECDRYYIRFHHGGNTWGAGHIMGIDALLPGSWRLPVPALRRVRRVLRNYYGLARRPGQACSQNPDNRFIRA